MISIKLYVALPSTQQSKWKTRRQKKQKKVRDLVAEVKLKMEKEQNFFCVFDPFLHSENLYISHNEFCS